VKSKCHTGAPHTKTQKLLNNAFQKFLHYRHLDHAREPRTHTHAHSDQLMVPKESRHLRECEQRGCYKARAQSADNRRAQRFFILKLNKITWKHQSGDVTIPRSLTGLVGFYRRRRSHLALYKAQGVAAPRESPAHPPPAHGPLALAPGTLCTSTKAEPHNFVLSPAAAVFTIHT
jgi:hypothetical protein